MKSTISLQLTGRYAHSSKQPKKALLCFLWIVQSLLALIFLFAGTMKLITPVDVLMAQMALPLPGWFVQCIGVAEVAGALGLILPTFLRIRPVLTPLAACGLVLIMIGATIITLITAGIVSALTPLIVGLLAAFVIYGRRYLFNIALI